MQTALKKKIKSQPCIVCGNSKVDACHIRSKGAGGPDEEWNLVPMCREHHTQQHRFGWGAFMNRHPEAQFVLKQMGWKWIDCVGKAKLWHERLGNDS
jgi:hypothetical protein